MTFRHTWETYTDNELLDLELSELGLQLKGSLVENCLKKLYSELNRRDLKFKPHAWISDEWFSPDGIPGIAIPFFLLHPRLMELEKKMIGNCEGNTEAWCMKLLRHEAGHAIDNAFHLRKKKARQEIFGLSSTPYPKDYEPKPYSKDFVKHLTDGYAQAHPDEDWAETFSVWLTPKKSWREKYCDWYALEKLEYIDSVMLELKGKSALTRNKKTIDSLNSPKLKNMTLRQYYNLKRKNLGLTKNDELNRDLKKIFCQKGPKNPKANLFIGKMRKSLSREVAKDLGLYQYRIDRLMKTMMENSKAQDLRLRSSEDRTMKQLSSLLSKKSSHYLNQGKHRIIM